MKKVLLVDDDEMIHEIVDSTLGSYKKSFEISHAYDIKEAVRQVDRGDIALVITDLVMPGGDGFQLLSYIQKKHSDIPRIVITSYDLPELKNRLAGKAFQVFKKPLASEELADAIIQGLKTQQKKGDLGKFSVVGIVQLMETEETTCRLDVHNCDEHQDIDHCIEHNCPEYKGSLFLVKGKIYDAVCGKLIGEEAVLKLLSLEGVQVSSCTLKNDVLRRVHKSNQNLLINAMIQKDNQSDDPTSTGSPRQKLLDEGIKLCERLELNKAQKKLMPFVRDNRKSALGWLWLSRSLTDLPKIKKALGEAYKCSPKDPQILEDVKKARLFQGSGKLIRCPFCFAPLEQHIILCSYCQANALSNSSTLAQIDPYKVERKVVLRAATRFERLLADEVNPRLLYYAGAAYLNLNDFEKALTYFDLLMPIVQVDKKLQKISKQVREIVDYIASSQNMDTDDRAKNSWHEQKEKREKRLITNRSACKTVLVVEDSPTTRKVIKMTLTSGDFRVIEAADGVEALSRLNEERPDLVLLDIMLPKIDGYRILSILKKNSDTKDIPVVMLTSKNRIIDKVKGRLSAASAYLTKPFKPAELIDMVNTIIVKDSARAEHSTENTVN
ncbi:MAG: response regulator [Candidatus Electrothrix sp. AW3_4]|nr:response regulator [Candidatus Electrothrix gigas]MCI5180006.1 response regulator [Candidatus Electrothrix gigas]